MKTIKIAVFLSIFLLALGAFAIPLPSLQNQDRQVSAVNDHLNVLVRRLNLSQEQQTKIKVILEDQSARLQEIRKETTLSQKDSIIRERSLNEASAAKTRALLNEDQRKTFDEMQRDHIGRGRGQGSSSSSSSGQRSLLLEPAGHGYGYGHGEGHGCLMPSAEDHLTFLSDKLTLNSNQQARIRLTLEDQLARLEAIREDESLSPEQRMSAAHSLREASAAKVRELLDDSQKKKFEEMRHDQREQMNERQERGADCSMIWNPID